MTQAGTIREASRAIDVVSVHAQHADFVWRSLLRLGVREEDAQDMLQEVFVVVHRRQSTFDGSSRMTTWLFGIALRVASDYRRRAHRKREWVTDKAGEGVASPDGDPERSLALSDARTRLAVVLDALDPEKRAVFVMFEIEGLGCSEIANTLGVPVGTIYSRLHAARAAFAQALARRDRGDSKRGMQ